MKEYVKNITNNRAFGFDATTLSFNEDGKRIVLKAGEKAETKKKGENIDGKRLKIVNENGELFGKGTKTTKHEFKLEEILDDVEEKKKKKKGDLNDN